MTSIYHININELTSEFIEGLKLQYKDKDVSLIIEVEDQTEYLNQSSKMIERIEESLTRNETYSLEEVHEKLNN